MYTICLKLMLHTKNIAMEGTVSQILYTSPHSFFIKCRKNIQKNNQKVFLHKIKTRTERKTLRQNSLNMDVGYVYTKFYISKLIIY